MNIYRVRYRVRDKEQLYLWKNCVDEIDAISFADAEYKVIHADAIILEIKMIKGKFQ